MRWFDTEHKMHILQIILMTEILMMHYSALTPVVCPKECSCGSIFGLKPYVKCDHVQAEYVYKVIAEIPQNTEEIRMTNTSLTRMYQLHGNFPRLLDLSLKNCSILNLREALQPFLFVSKKKIYSISVTFNDITIVQEDTFQSLVMLQQLDLCHNKIQNIDERAFTDAWKLRILKLCHNKLKQLKKNLFLSNVELVSLYLENNFFENIPIVSLKVLKNLKLLDLSANNIQFIPSLSALSSIKFLYLSNNKIRTIASNAFDGLQHLSMLLLSGNKINNLPEEMSIQFHLMDLGQIILHDNPLTCSCQNWWLISWQKKRCKLHNNTKECALMCFQNGTSLLMENFDLNNLICGCKEQCYCSTASVGLCKVTCYDDSADLQTRQCSSCPEGSHPLFDGASGCVCQKGHTLVDGVCEQCPEGSFKSFVGQAPCTTCPQYSTSHRASTSADHCVCQYGEFKILSDQKRKCQRYENEEIVRLGIGPAVSPMRNISIIGKPKLISGMEPRVTSAPKKNDQLTEHENKSKTPDDVVFGIVGIAIVLFCVGTGFSVYKWKQKHQTHLKFPKLLTCKSSYQYEERHDSLIYSTKLENYYKGLKVASGQLKVGKVIGRGAFGMVHEGYLRDTKDENAKKVAIKRLKEEATREEQEALQLELDHMMYVGKHPNIIELIGLCSMKGSMMLVLEYASNGDLLSYLRRCSTIPGLQLNSPGFGSNKTAVELFRTLIMFAWHVSKGMCHLEKLKCIHRDIAARNILLTQDPIAKISDFGLSRDVYESSYYFKVSKGRLPFKWMSPEALLMGQYSIKSDVWSFGILLWEVVTLGGNPFAGIPVESLCEMYAHNYRLPKPATCPDYQYKLMLECWAERTQDRPSFNDIESRLDGLLQRVANRDYINLLEEENTRPRHQNRIRDSTENKTTCLSAVYDTDSDDMTFHESSDSDSITEINSDMLLHQAHRSHPTRKTSQQSASDRQSATSKPNQESSQLVSSIELQNLSDSKIQMLSNPIYGSRRKLKETKCT